MCIDTGMGSTLAANQCLMEGWMTASILQTIEGQRLVGEGADAWRVWGPYLSERQWGTVR